MKRSPIIIPVLISTDVDALRKNSAVTTKEE
jgi:hypothetical protein